MHFLEEEPEFAYETLSFLFESKSPEVYEHLFTLQDMHRDLMGHIKLLRELLVKKQEKLESAMGESGAIGLQEARAALGTRLVFEIVDELGTVDGRIRFLETRYVETASRLRAAMRSLFGPDTFIPRIAQPLGHLANMASLIEPDRAHHQATA